MSKGITERDRTEWERRGGRVRIDAKGRAVFIIRKQVDGRRFEVSTRKHTLGAALAEWDRFEKDPDAYQPGGDQPLLLDNDLVIRFLAYSKNEAGNSTDWVREKRRLLAWWMGKLRGVNLRRASLQHDIVPALDGAPNRPKRIEVIKAFFGWMRKVEHLVKPHEDPTFGGVLTVPPPRPAQVDRSKVIPKEHYLMAREHLVGQYRDALDVLAGTGWHISEVMRFANGGEVEPLPKAMRVQNGAVAVLLCPLHKSGAPHRTAVSQEVKEAAERLRASGWPADSKFPFYKAVASACRAASIAPFPPGQFRHSVATWAIEAGADIASVAGFLGHRSPATTRKFYATHAVPVKVPTLA